MKINQIFEMESAEKHEVKLTKKVFDELWVLEYDTLEPYNAQPKHDLVKAMETAKKKGNTRILMLHPTTISYLKSALDNAVDIAEDNNNRRLVNGLMKAKRSL